MPLKTERSLWAIYVMLRKILFKQDLKWGHARLISIFVQFLSYMRFQEILKSEMRRNEHSPFSAEEKSFTTTGWLMARFQKSVFTQCIHQESPGPTPKAGYAGSKPLGVPSRQNPSQKSSEGFKMAYSPFTLEVEKVTGPGI